MTVGSFGGTQDWSASDAARRILDSLSAAFHAEREQWILWLPVALGTGVAIYFWLTSEPPWWGGVLWALAGVALAVLSGPARLAPYLLAWAMAASGAGFAAAQWRAHWVATPLIGDRLGPVEITGRVLDRDLSADGSKRVVLGELSIPGLSQAETPRHVRLRLHAKHGEQAVLGRRIVVRAMLQPASPPVAPGAYDFQRHAYFQGIGATGFSIAPARVLRDDGRPWSFWVALEQLREDVGQRIRAGIDHPVAGPLASALLIGDRAGIPESVQEAMRDAGLAHLIAISGLNFALVAGILFFVARGLLSLIEPLALGHPIKKWAAVVAFCGAAFYFLLTGPTPPTERSFLMIGVILLAILVDREAISMRLVAWAAVVILLIVPEVLTGASFQMSFAAVAALVAAYEGLRFRFAAWREGSGPIGRIGLYVAAVLLTTVIGSAATGIYAAYHFNRFPLYGLIANLIAVPITAHWIMPWGMLALALMPFGLEHLALVPMGWGAQAVIATAEIVASWPGAVALLPAMPHWGLLAGTAGLIWLCLWRGRWRLVGIAPIVAGLMSMLLVGAPDILVAGDARLMAVRGPDGLVLLADKGASKIAIETWLRRAGQSRVDQPRGGKGPDPAAASFDSPSAALDCDAQACIYRRNGYGVALVRDDSAVVEECARAEIVVSLVPIRRGCRAAAIVIDRFALWRHGAHAIWLERGTPVRVESVAAERGTRPWVAQRRGRTAAPLRLSELQ